MTLSFVLFLAFGMLQLFVETVLRPVRVNLMVWRDDAHCQLLRTKERKSHHPLLVLTLSVEAPRPAATSPFLFPAIRSDPASKPDTSLYILSYFKPEKGISLQWRDDMFSCKLQAASTM
jgi:hypothetical protein